MSVHKKCQSIKSSRLACYGEQIDVMYSPKGFFPSATSQVFHSRSARPQPVLAAELGPPSPTYMQRSAPACSSRSNRPPSATQPLCLAPIVAYGASESLPNLWEVAALEIAHLRSCHLRNCYLGGSRPWENAFGKIPNTSIYVNVLTRLSFVIK